MRVTWARIMAATLIIAGTSLGVGLGAMPAQAYGGSGWCLELHNNDGDPLACMNAWGGGPWVRVYTQIHTNNNQFGVIFAQGSWGSAYAMQYQGGGPWNGMCIGDAYNDPNRADASLDPCPSSTSSGGWGTHITPGIVGCYVDNGGNQSGWWYDNHWGGYIGTGQFQNGAPWYLNVPFSSNPDYACTYGVII